MHDAIENLYATFSHCRIGDDFRGCACCVRPEKSAKLAAVPLRALTFHDLDYYSRQAISTWGNVRHFKHFLPRLLELSIEHRDDFLDLAVVFGKIKYAQFDSWPQRERDSVDRFFDQYWEYQLEERIHGAFENSSDTVLCALSNALSSVQRFLDAWIEKRTDDAKRHFASFIMNNAATLLKKGRLTSAFWNTTGQPHAEVINWLQSDAVFGYVDEADESLQVDDFSYAWPQFIEIRSSLAKRKL